MAECQIQMGRECERLIEEVPDKMVCLEENRNNCLKIWMSEKYHNPSKNHQVMVCFFNHGYSNYWLKTFMKGQEIKNIFGIDNGVI